MTYDFISAYILHFSESQDPIPGNLSSLAQTGDFWFSLIALLFLIVALSIAGIFVSKKLVKSNISVGEAIMTKKGILISASVILLICFSACILINNKANAGENHIDPSFEDMALDVNAYVGNPSGKISVETFKLKNIRPEAEEFEVVNVHDLSVIAGNGLEDIKAHIKITDVTVNEVLFDGYMNSSDWLCHSVHVDDEIKIEFIDMSPEDAKKFIDKDGLFISMGGHGIKSEHYSDNTLVEVVLSENEVQVTDTAKNILKQEGWNQTYDVSDRSWEKFIKAGTKTQDVLSVFDQLINNGEIICESVVFAGWQESFTSCLSATIPYYYTDDRWAIQACWTESPREKINYVLTLKDVNDYDFELTEIGENVLNNHSEWYFDEANNCLVCKDVSIDLKPRDVISIWTSETVQVKDSSLKAYFNYWGDGLAPVSNSIQWCDIESGQLELNICSWLEDPVNTGEDAPAAEAAASEAAVVDEAVTADEAAVEAVEDEAVAVDELPVVDQIIDYVTEKLPEVATPLVLMFLWFL